MSGLGSALKLPHTAASEKKSVVHRVARIIAGDPRAAMNAFEQVVVISRGGVFFDFC